MLTGRLTAHLPAATRPLRRQLAVSASNGAGAATRVLFNDELLTTEETAAIRLRDGAGGASTGPLVQVRARARRWLAGWRALRFRRLALTSPLVHRSGTRATSRVRSGS